MTKRAPTKWVVTEKLPRTVETVVQRFRDEYSLFTIPPVPCHG
jgi:hypothetical protein